MKLYLIIIASICSLSCLNASASSLVHCEKSSAPKVIKPMADWDIIATNVGTIPMKTVFSGDHLSYSMSVHPTNRENVVTINKVTGVVKVDAERKDNFDVTVKAKNSCGEISNTFNVIIDEEE